MAMFWISLDYYLQACGFFFRYDVLLQARTVFV